MNLHLVGFLCILGIQYIMGKVFWSSVTFNLYFSQNSTLFWMIYIYIKFCIIYSVTYLFFVHIFYKPESVNLLLRKASL